jgi:uncharacterized protein (DUF1778 family)
MRKSKTLSMSIRVSVSELEKLKKAAEKLSYSSYSEFVRRTALIEAVRVLGDEAASVLLAPNNPEGKQ